MKVYKSMPNLRNAKKSLLQSRARAELNKAGHAHLDQMRRNFRKMLEAGKIEDAVKLMRELGKALDKAVTKKLVKPNAAARLKSRAQVRLNSASKK